MRWINPPSPRLGEMINNLDTFRAKNPRVAVFGDLIPYTPQFFPEVKSYSAAMNIEEWAKVKKFRKL